MECPACTVACILILHVLTFLVMAWAKDSCHFQHVDSGSLGVGAPQAVSTVSTFWDQKGSTGKRYSSLGLRSSRSRLGDVKLLRHEVVGFSYIFSSLQWYSTWLNASRTDALRANKASMKLQGMELPAPGQKPADRFPTNCRVTKHPKQLQAQNHPNTTKDPSRFCSLWTFL